MRLLKNSRAVEPPGTRPTIARAAEWARSPPDCSGGSTFDSGFFGMLPPYPYSLPGIYAGWGRLSCSPPRLHSAASPAEGDDLLVAGALRDVAAAGVPEHERDVVLRVYLEDVGHPTPTARAVRVLDVLYPRRPAGQFVPRLADGDFLGSPGDRCKLRGNWGVCLFTASRGGPARTAPFLGKSRRFSRHDSSSSLHLSPGEPFPLPDNHSWGS
jgi:hypothetical protein